jgi:hypothetical protein
LTATLESFLAFHPALGPEESVAGSRERLFPLRLPVMAPSRAFAAAWLVVPRDFPNSSASIRLSKDAVLRIPHIEADGKLCFPGDPGPASGINSEDRLKEVLHLFDKEFLVPWLGKELDGEFEGECRSYWQIWVSQRRSKVDAISRVFTVDGVPEAPRIVSARLMLPDRTLIVDDDGGIANNLITSLGPRANQMMRVFVADIPIEFPWTPLVWPKSVNEIETLLKMRLSDREYRDFSKIKGNHRVALFRSPNCIHGYLLPNGPLTVIKRGKSKFAVPTRELLPLNVERMDPNWTYGRDQIAAVKDRQGKHILVLGAGALASPVIDQLARAGIGRISVVDPQMLTSPNIGRHLLGAESLHESKASSVARRVTLANPACTVEPFELHAETWLRRRGLSGIDAILDLTGEPDVRFAVDTARQEHSAPLLVSWMEPFVAAAHSACLPTGSSWFKNGEDPLLDLQAVTWPDEVIQREPGCNSTFQSYTPSQASFAVSLTAESALALIDGEVEHPIIRSWIRGQPFLDKHRPGLELRPWAAAVAVPPLDGIIWGRTW